MFLVVGAGPDQEPVFVTHVGMGKEKLAGTGAGARAGARVRVGVIVGTNIELEWSPNLKVDECKEKEFAVKNQLLNVRPSTTAARFKKMMSPKLTVVPTLILCKHLSRHARCQRTH